MIQLHSSLEKLIGLKWEKAISVVQIKLIPPAAEAVMSGGYLQPQILKEVILELLNDYRQLMLTSQEAVAKLGLMANALPASPWEGVELITKTTREFDKRTDERQDHEAKVLCLLNQYQAIGQGAIRWDSMGFFEKNRVEIYVPVIRTVADQYKMFSYELEQVVCCYWLSRALLEVGVDNEGRKWAEWDRVDGELLHSLAMYVTSLYCYCRGLSLSRSFKIMVRLTGCQKGIWEDLQNIDKDRVNMAIHLARQKETGLSCDGFLGLIDELSYIG